MSKPLLNEEALAGTDDVEMLRCRLRAVTAHYNELVMAVGLRFPGESRHDTALRYIREAEERRKSDVPQQEAA